MGVVEKQRLLERRIDPECLLYSSGGPPTPSSSPWRTSHSRRKRFLREKRDVDVAAAAVDDDVAAEAARA